MSDSASAYGQSVGTRRPWRPRLVTLVIVAATLALNLFQQPGRITFDTKLDLQFNVGDFLVRSLSLWNGDSAVGGLQNQASGYLFPMGPAFWLGDALDIPMWVWERLWSAAIMLLAYAGVRRLAAQWPGIGRRGAVLAGLTYMLAPRVLTTVGGLSGETLPAAILPWTVLPLVLYLRGKLSARLAFVWSAATIAWMGGQNATLVVACLVLPGLLVLLAEGRTWRRRLLDSLGWGSLVVVACLWWLVPLLLMGGYAPPFLDFIESSYNTASDTSWLSSVRGTSHWVAFFPDGGSAGWVGGYELASSSILLVTTLLVAGAGLLGLAHSGLWQRRVLMVSVLVGLAVLTLGSGGWAGSVLADPWLNSLDTWLAPLRNVHKFDPLVRLPLSLGLGAFVTAGLPELVERRRQVPSARMPHVLLALTGVLALLVGAAAQPAASGNLRAEGGMSDISTPWRDAADYLGARSGPVSVLVLPGSGFAVQTWGRTVDEPIQVLGGPPWTSRSQGSVAPAGTLRLLDSIEDQLAEGRPLTGFSDALSRMGITHVVVRNDLDPARTSAAPPELVNAAIAGSTGLDAVAAFGRAPGGRPAVEVFAVDGTGDDPRISILDAADGHVVQGGPEAVTSLAETGQVTTGQPLTLASGDPDEALDVVTDSNQRVERSFGRVQSAVSGVMTSDEAFRLRRPVHDYTGDSIPTDLTVAQYAGAKLITASSSRGYADILGPVLPEEHPYAAFDSSGFTAWGTAPFTDPEGQWIEVQLDGTIDPGPVDLAFDKVSGADVSEVRLTTDAGSEIVQVAADGTADDIDLPGTSTSRIRLTVVKTRAGISQVRLTNFAIEDHRITRSLLVPGAVRAGTTVHLTSEPTRRACVSTGSGVACNSDWQRESPEGAGFDRTISVAEAGAWRITGRAVATNGQATAQLFAPVSGDEVKVTATSTFAGDPAVVAANVFDARTDTSWYASPLDPAAGVQLSWRKARTIRSVTAVLGQDQPGDLPEVLVVDPLTKGSEPQLVATSGDRAGVMTPVRTNRLRVTAFADYSRRDGVGIAELRIKGLQGLQHVSDPRASTGVGCGFGPTVEVDGRTIQTRITGTLGDVVSGAELEVRPCNTGTVRIGAGAQLISVTSPAGFAVSRLWLEPADPLDPPAVTGPEAEVTSWSPTERKVAVRTDAPAVLALAQSDNRGWEARLDGARLDPVVLDGWKQGWRLPAGSHGDVTMEFTPQGTFVAGVIVGLLLALLLNVLAVATFVRHRLRLRGSRSTDDATMLLPGSGTIGSGWRPRWLGLAAGAVVLTFVSVPLCLGAAVGLATRRATFAVLSAAGVALLLVAALAAIADPGSVVIPPAISDVLVAFVVGGVAGRVWAERDQLEGGGP